MSSLLLVLSDAKEIAMIKTIFVSILATLFLAGTFATLTGCSTVVGGGKEMEQGGKPVKDEANENK